MATKTRHDWTKLDPLIDRLRENGFNDTQIAKKLSIGRQTLVDHLRSRDPGIPEVHSDTPEPQGTLEGHQEVMEDIQQSVPEAPHVVTEAYQSVPQPPDIPEEAHPSTPEVHQDVSLPHSSMEHSGVPTRQAYDISTPMVHPGTPTSEDWELWTTIKRRWQEIEKMLADRQALLSTPLGTPGNTQKKTYLFDVRHIALIDRYAQDHRLELKDVIYVMCEQFFQRR
jgi:hypothetical protein